MTDIDPKLTAPTDARTAPVAVWKVLSELKGEALQQWRVAEVRNRPSADERGIDLPFPLGWFAIGYSDELAIGEVQPIRYFARELAMWRGEDGRARVVDAYCRHLGAHMAMAAASPAICWNALSTLGAMTNRASFARSPMRAPSRRR